MDFKTRVILSAAIFVCFFVGSPCTARAITEYCPARVSDFHNYGSSSSDGASQLFSYRIEADGARSVTGHIVLKTKTGWFVAPFYNAQLSLYEERWQTASMKFRRRNFVSSPLYGEFPGPESIVDAFVQDATTVGDPFFGWDQKGAVTCAAPSGFSADLKRAKSNQTALLNPLTDLEIAPAKNAGIANAVRTRAPGLLDCKEPFTNALVDRAAQLVYPTMAEEMQEYGTVLVQVAVDTDGPPRDAWLWAPSGNKLIDEAALNEAERSTYKAGTAFCQDAPGIYVFRADFVPY